MKTLSALLAAAGLVTATLAQAPGTPLVLTRSFEHRLASAAVGDAYVIQVRLPENYDPANVRYPVLYVLDADFWFGAASDIATYLPMVKESPAMIVVGIAYGGTHDDWWQKRARDYVPKALRTPPPPQFPLAGGADRFQQFLAMELFPFVEQNYAARADDRMLVGLSFGGTFAVHTLFTRPELFQNYIILAPGLGGDKKQLFETETAFHAQHGALPASVFFAIGEQDNPGMVKNWQAFADQVAAHHYEGLRWTAVLFPAETHISVYPTGLTRGLKTIHAAAIAPVAASSLAVSATMTAPAAGQNATVDKATTQPSPAPAATATSAAPPPAQTEKKISLTDAPPDQRLRYTAWRTDYYICTGIAYAKSLGHTVEDFAAFVASQHDIGTTSADGLTKFAQLLYFGLTNYPKGQVTVTAESGTAITMQFNRAYAAYFKKGPVLGVTLDEFERCFWGHIAIMARRDGFGFSHRIEDGNVVFTISLEKRTAQEKERIP